MSADTSIHVSVSGAPDEAEVISGMHEAIGSLGKDKKTAPPPPAFDTDNDKKRLRSIVDRIVRLEEEKKALAGDIKDIYAEAKSGGFSKRALRLLVKEELEDADARESREAAEFEKDRMKVALGDYVSTPLGDFATRGRH